LTRPYDSPLRFRCETAIEAPRDTSRRSPAGWLFESRSQRVGVENSSPNQVLGCGRRRLFAPTLLEGCVCKPIERCERHRCRTPSPPAGSACRASYAHAIPRQSKQANGRHCSTKTLAPRYRTSDIHRDGTRHITQRTLIAFVRIGPARRVHDLPGPTLTSSFPSSSRHS